MYKKYIVVSGVARGCDGADRPGGTFRGRKNRAFGVDEMVRMKVTENFWVGRLSKKFGRKRRKMSAAGGRHPNYATDRCIYCTIL